MVTFIDTLCDIAESMCTGDGSLALKTNYIVWFVLKNR